MQMTFGLLLALWAAAAIAQEQAVEVTEPLTPREMLARLQDVPAELHDWRLLPQLHTCDRECLPQDLPHDAAAILSYDYLWSISVVYIPDEPPQELHVDVIRMASDLDAYGIYSYPRTPQSAPAAVKSESYWNGDQLHIWRGPFYLRVTPAITDEVLKAAALAAGEAVAAKLPLPAQLPLMMRLIPEARAAPYALRYYRQNVLGQVPLGPGLVNQYLENGTTFRIILIQAATPAAAAQMYVTASALLAEGTPTEFIPALGQEAQVIHSPRHGLCHVMLERNYVALALGITNRQTAEGLLRITATNIRIAR